MHLALFELLSIWKWLSLKFFAEMSLIFHIMASRKLPLLKEKKKDLAPNLQLVKGYIKLENNIYRTV